jgi:hypothetical protein
MYVVLASHLEDISVSFFARARAVPSTAAVPTEPYSWLELVEILVFSFVCANQR